MNNIVYAGRTPNGDRTTADGMLVNKALKIFVPDKGGEAHWEAVFIPPMAPHKFSNILCGGITVLIEQPLCPLKEVTFAACDNDYIRQAAEQAVYFFNDDGSSGREAVLAALGNLLISYILTFYPRTYSPAVKALREDIDQHFADGTFSADAAIRKLPLNYDYVRKLFKKEVGITPHEYLTRLRMQRAKDVLLSGVTNRYSDYTVTQIAEACGFLEPLYFSRVFKQYYGVAPSHYLKNLKSADNSD